MEDIRDKQQDIDDKIKELQQQVRFCVNNYDFYHKNNELDILQEQTEKLQEAEIVYRGFLEQVKKLREKVEQGHRMCDDVDKLIRDMNLTEESEKNDESDKENRKHVHFEGVGDFS